MCGTVPSFEVCGDFALEMMDQLSGTVRPFGLEPAAPIPYVRVAVVEIE